MAVISTLKYKIHSKRINSCLKKISEYEFHWEWLIDSATIPSSKSLIHHCVADGYTPEESVLYMVACKFKKIKTPQQFFLARRFYPFNKISSYPNYAKNNFSLWYEVADDYRDTGRTCSKVFDEFQTVLNQLRKRYPQLFSGDLPELKYFWQVNFHTNVPFTFGVAPIYEEDLTSLKKDDGKLFKSANQQLATCYQYATNSEVARFELFSDASNYINENCIDDMWWHTLDLDFASENDIPKWTKTPTPKDFFWTRSEQNVKHSENKSQVENLLFECIFAMPMSTYKMWRESLCSDKNEMTKDLLPDSFLRVTGSYYGMDIVEYTLDIPIHQLKCWSIRRRFYYLIKEKDSYVEYESNHYESGYHHQPYKDLENYQSDIIDDVPF